MAAGADDELAYDVNGWPILTPQNYRRALAPYTSELAAKLATGDANIAAAANSATKAANSAKAAQDAAGKLGVWETIPAATNLDTLLTHGWRICTSTADAKTMINKPSALNEAFGMLTISPSAASPFNWQLILEHWSGRCWVRRIYNGSVGPWSELLRDLPRAEVNLGALAAGISAVVDANYGWNGVKLYTKNGMAVLSGAVSGAVKDNVLTATPIPVAYRPPFSVAATSCEIQADGRIIMKAAGVVSFSASWTLP